MDHSETMLIFCTREKALKDYENISGPFTQIFCIIVTESNVSVDIKNISYIIYLQKTSQKLEMDYENNSGLHQQYRVKEPIYVQFSSSDDSLLTVSENIRKSWEELRPQYLQEKNHYGNL